MKENKFRVWDTFTKKMVFEGFNVIGEVTCFNGIEQYGDEHPNPAYESSLMRLNDFILMQFTGLADKNGKDLYENDLVIHKHDLSVYQVIWVDEEAKFILNLVKGNGNDSIDEDLSPLNLSLFTIIGNIYEKPEWLEIENER